MSNSIKITASILSSDFSLFADEIARVEEVGADLLHIDVMDKRFRSEPHSWGPGDQKCGAPRIRAPVTPLMDHETQ